jgi:hypothetical protein
VAGDERDPAHDMVTLPTFRADGTRVYAISDGNRHAVIAGTERSGRGHRLRLLGRSRRPCQEITDRVGFTFPLY